MIRVLFLTESFFPVLGGGERHIRALATGLTATGMPSIVLTRRTEREWPAVEVLEGVRVVRVSPTGPGRWGKYRMIPAAMLALLRNAAYFDVLVVRGTRVLGLPGLLTGRMLGKPVVLQAEINGEMSGQVYTWGTSLDRSGIRRLVSAAVTIRNRWMSDADAFVAMSRMIRDELRAAGVPETRLALIPHGVDTNHFRPVSDAERQAARQRLRLPGRAVIIVYTGRLLRGKGLETLLEAFRVLAAEPPEVHLVLVGSGASQSLSIEDGLRARVRDDGLTARVTFTGHVTDVRDHLTASDIFAFPSVFEALGLSLIEAAACGLACVGSRTGGIVDVIEHDRTGLLVTPGSVEDLGAALRSLVSDSEERRVLGARACALVRERYDLATNLEAYRALFSELVRRPRSRRSACWRGRAPREDAVPPRSRGIPA